MTVEQRKHPAKMSFWSEERSAKVNSVKDPGERAYAYARRLISHQPDAGLLAAMIFGDTP